jgi:Mn2+/Fe2+ NRAMP family transporter
VPVAFYVNSVIAFLLVGFAVFQGLRFALDLPKNMMGELRTNVILAVLAAIVLLAYAISGFYLILRGQAQIKGMLADRGGAGR